MVFKSKEPAPGSKDKVVRANAAPRDGVRETIESIMIALVLAFMFRTFEAEAFVIPTGSMAPTLMGRHKDIECPECGFRFAVNASSEVDTNTSAKKEGVDIIAGICPNCRAPIDFGRHDEHPSYKGDRILVTKFAYQLSGPERWDVTVFKYPLQAKQNFIKRVVGLPNETLIIWHGDIFTCPDGTYDGPLTVPLMRDLVRDHQVQIQRKPPAKLQAMLQLVNDGDYLPEVFTKQGWPLRWQQHGGAPQWSTPDAGKSFATEGAAGDAPVWLRYGHRVPTLEEWTKLQNGQLTTEDRATAGPQLIGDFYGYNTGAVQANNTERWIDPLHIITPEMHWVGDLAFDCRLKSSSEQGTITLELVEGGVLFHCTFDLATGKATLSHTADDGYHPSAQTALRGKGSHRVMFANADDKLYLWVDGKSIDFDTDTAYGPQNNRRPQATDLEPVGISSSGVKLEVQHLRVLRDLYYIAIQPFSSNTLTDFPHDTVPREGFDDVKDLFTDPNRWGIFDSQGVLAFHVPAGHYLMLGDNSPQSMDSRLWVPELQFVDENLLIGKALFIYWPHALDKVPGTGIPFPFTPNTPRMGFVR